MILRDGRTSSHIRQQAWVAANSSMETERIRTRTKQRVEDLMEPNNLTKNGKRRRRTMVNITISTRTRDKPITKTRNGNLNKQKPADNSLNNKSIIGIEQTCSDDSHKCRCSST